MGTVGRQWRSLLAVTAAGMVMGGVLGGAPASAMVPKEDETRAAKPAAVSLNAAQLDAVRAFQQAFPGVSDQEAWQRIVDEDKRVALITRLAKDEAVTFGGSWYDGATNTQHLQATTAGSVAAFGKLAGSQGVKTQVHKVDYSYAQLKAEADQARAGNHPVLGAAAKGDAAVDVEANRVVAGLATADLNAVRSKALTLPATFQVRQKSGPGVEEVCESRVNCSMPLRSGVGVQNVRGDLLCSLGFTARDKDDASKKFAITAAHCGEEGALFKHHTWSIGHHARQVQNYGNGKDAAAIRVENPHWLDSTFGWIYNPNDRDDPHKVTGRLTSESGIQKGQVVCLAARHSGADGNCGTIDGFTGDDFVRVVGHDACPGDSGGGWHRPTDNGRIAYGIHRGQPTEPSSCHGDNGNKTDIFTSLPRAEVGMDVIVHTR